MSFEWLSDLMVHQTFVMMFHAVQVRFTFVLFLSQMHWHIAACNILGMLRNLTSLLYFCESTKLLFASSDIGSVLLVHSRLWSDVTWGSLQNLDLPEDMKALYKTVWEIKQRVLVDMAADRGAFIDQSQVCPCVLLCRLLHWWKTSNVQK